MDAEAAKREDRDLFILPKTMNVEATKLSILRVHLQDLYSKFLFLLARISTLTGHLPFSFI